MAGKREKPEDIVLKLRQVEVFKAGKVSFRGCSTNRRHHSDLLSVARGIRRHESRSAQTVEGA